MDRHEGEIATALNLPNLASVTVNLEIFELNFIEGLLARPLESFRPTLIT